MDVLVQSKRNKHAALKLMRELLRKYAVVPERMVTDYRRGCYRDPTSASKPEITSKSSSSMPLWRNRWKVPWSCLQQFVDVLVGALHRRQAACVLARQGFGAGPEERDEEIFADERAQGRGAAAHDLGQVARSANGISARSCCHCASSGNSRWLTGSYSAPDSGRLWKT